MSEEKKKEIKRVVLKVGTQRTPGKGDLVLMTMGKTRWERFVNLILLPWRYIWHGKFKL